MSGVASTRGRAHRRRIGPGVADREDLPEMPVCVLPVQVLAAEATVDLLVVVPARGAAVRDALRLDPAEDRVEIALAHSKAHVQALDALSTGEVEGERLVDVDRTEATLRFRPRRVEQAGH